MDSGGSFCNHWEKHASVLSKRVAGGCRTYDSVAFPVGMAKMIRHVLLEYIQG